MHIGLHVQNPLYFGILMNLEFSRQIFEKNTQISNFMKIRSVGAKMFHADGRNDMSKLRVALRNFTESPRKKLLNSVLDPPDNEIGCTRVYWIFH